MESNAILIGWPSESVRELYSTDASVYFLDNHGWWAYDEIIGERHG